MEEHTSPFRRTNADALPRLGAGYFSGVMPSAGAKTNPIWTGFSPYLDRSLPCGPGLTASSLKLPSRLYYQTVPKQRWLWSSAEYVKPARLNLN